MNDEMAELFDAECTHQKVTLSSSVRQVCISVLKACVASVEGPTPIDGTPVKPQRAVVSDIKCTEYDQQGNVLRAFDITQGDASTPHSRYDPKRDH